MDYLKQAVLVAVLCQMFVSTDSGVDFYGCKTISVSGIDQFPALNGLYDKIFECFAYPVFRLRESNINMYYHLEESRWVIGTPTDAAGCDSLYGAKHVIGQGNKLYPHMVEADWREKSGGGFRDNPDIAVECDDIHWTIGCTMYPFPVRDTRCYNRTSAIEVQDVYVIQFPGGNRTLCMAAELLCNQIGRCDLEELECKRKLPPTDYDYVMAKLNCDGRHVQCHRYLVEARYHIDCDVNAAFPCDSHPDIRGGILIEYKCRRSRKYLAPEAPIKEKLPDFPEQIIPTCHTTTKSNSVPSQNAGDEEDDNTLMYYVAPSAGVLFLIIIIAVIAVTICRRRKSNDRPTIISQKKRPVEQRTYANIPAQGAARQNRPRPDFTDKRRKANPASSPTSAAANPDKRAVNGVAPSRTPPSGSTTSVSAHRTPYRNGRPASRTQDRSHYGHSPLSRGSSEYDGGRGSVGVPRSGYARSENGSSGRDSSQYPDSDSPRRYRRRDPNGRLPLVDSVLADGLDYKNPS